MSAPTEYLIAETAPDFEPPAHWTVAHAWPGVCIVDHWHHHTTELTTIPGVLSVSEASAADVRQLVKLRRKLAKA